MKEIEGSFLFLFLPSSSSLYANEISVLFYLYRFGVMIAGLVCDMLWSDPDPNVVGWAPNERGVSNVFGVEVLAQFLRRMDLDIVVRGHQVSVIRHPKRYL